MRLLAPVLGVLLLAVMIGCGGGGGSPSFGTDPDTAGSSSGDVAGGTGTTDLRPLAGNYTATFSSSTGASSTAAGTAGVGAAGAVSVSLPASNASDGTLRSVTATVATDGTATGAITVGTDSFTPSAVTLTTSGGTYVLALTFVNSSLVSETDTFTLTLQQSTYSLTSSGTDNQSGKYTGSGTATLKSGNLLALDYVSTRRPGNTAPPYQRLSMTLLSDGTFTGTMSFGTDPTGVTGTWGATSTGLKLVLTYVNPQVFSLGTGASPTVTETLTLTRG